MTSDEKKKIARLQKEGFGYRAIAAELDLPLGSVKSWCRRHPASPASGVVCLQCGASIVQLPHKKKRRFCSDACRFAWWTAHPEKRENGMYQHVCAYCGASFRNSRPAASYCGRDCFAKARMKGMPHG